MKKILVIIDGMQDEPIPEFNGKTPMEVARMPVLNKMKRLGKFYHCKIIPDDLEPTTDNALLSILGYTPNHRYSSRSWFEALGAGIEVNENDLCLRCNLISHSKGILTSHCGGKLSNDLCKKELEIIKQNFENEKYHFYSLGGFRNLLVIKNCNATINANPPHDLLGCEINNLRIDSDDSELSKELNNMTHASFILLNNYQANGIAFWSPGKPPVISHKISGSMIAATPLVKGIGRAIGMNVIEVEGTTGDEKTNLKAKVDVTFKAINQDEFVILHIEAPDELSHRRDPVGKMKFLEKIDREVFLSLLKNFHNIEIRIQADHATSSLTGKHLQQDVEIVEYQNI